MQVTTQYASEHLDELLTFADGGGEIEIAREGKPAAKLIVVQARPALEGNCERILGAGQGELRVPSDEEWKAMGKELEDLMLNSPLFPAKTR